jgi:hypothetical protein
MMMKHIITADFDCWSARNSEDSPVRHESDRVGGGLKHSVEIDCEPLFH